MEAHSERRVVTALFIDVVGSTDLMMRVGPEVMRRRLADAFAQMSARIGEFGGTVENYAGDAILAIFGAPVSHVDDPARALRAAQACADWSADALGKDRLSFRAGIETGEALIDLAAVEQHERMAVGRCVNIAARLQQQADPGQTVVGPTCHEATDGLAAFEPLGALNLKGLGTIEGWRFIEFISEPHAPSVPIIGRDRELKVLEDAADRAAQGTAMLALIVGDPGLGKSRLAEELIFKRGGPLRVIQARCRPAGEEGANTPLRQLVDAEVGSPTADAIRDRLAALLGPTEYEPIATAVLHSTGLVASPELQAITRFEQREAIAEAWRRYLIAVAHEQPLIISVEDLHWADPVLIRMIDHVTSDASAPLLVIGSARPEFLVSAHIRPAENRIQIDLEPLDASAASALAEAARGTVAGLERAAGNPLFIIELARARSATHATDLPMTIHAAISARLDELSPDERQLLQHASVAGETFDVRDAALLADREPAEVAGMLGRLAHLGFVDPVEQGFRFHHALVRDVAYGRLTVSTRLALHARYATAGVAHTDAVAQAFHLWEATKPPDADWAWEDASRLEALRSTAFDAQLAAGRRLEARNQYEQAERIYGQAVELADGAEKRAVALAELARAIALQGRGDDTWAARLQALDAYAEAGVTPPSRLYADMLEIVSLNWGYFQQMPPDDQVHKLLDEGERLARASGDDVSLARLLADRVAFTGDPSAVDEVLRLVDKPDAVPFADAAQRLAQMLFWAGRIDRALELYGKVFDELIPAGAVINEPEALVWYGGAAYSAGELALARSVAERLRELAANRSPHTRSHLLGLVAMVETGAGDWERVWTVAREVEELVVANPQATFCLIGCTGVGYGAAARIMSGLPVATDLDTVAERMVPRSELIQASSIMLPRAMRGDATAALRGMEAFAPGLGLLDRAGTWDVCGLVPAMVLTIAERWDVIDAALARLDECAARGSRLTAALAAAVREERAAAQGDGSMPAHTELRGLGYDGISELLRYRAAIAQPAWH